MPPGLRERKKVETRQAIADAALSLALERGPASVTIDDIAAAADVSPRTVFNYFATKDEAILGIEPGRRAELCEQLAARPADEPPLVALREVLIPRMTANDDVGSVWRARAKLATDHPQLAAAQAAAHRALEEELAVVVADRCGLAVADVYPGVVVAAVLTATRLGLERAVCSSRPSATRLRTELEAVFAHLARGLVPPTSTDVTGRR